LPTANPDQLALFKSAARRGLTVEPWVSRLRRRPQQILLEEREVVTTVPFGQF
jgi:hypothetical protein